MSSRSMGRVSAGSRHYLQTEFAKQASILSHEDPGAQYLNDAILIENTASTHEQLLKAEELYQRAVDANDGPTETATRLSNYALFCYYRLHKLEKAADLLRQAIDLDPEPEFQFRLAEVMFAQWRRQNMGRPQPRAPSEELVELFEAAADEYTTDAYVLCTVADFHRAKGDIDSARDFLQSAVEQDIEDTTFCSTGQGPVTESRLAIKYAQFLLETDGESGYAEAKEVLTTAQDAEPANLAVTIALADVYRRMKKTRQAERLLRRAMKRHPNAPAPEWALGMLMCSNEYHREGRKMMLKALAHESHRPNPEHLITYATVMMDVSLEQEHEEHEKHEALRRKRAAELEKKMHSGHNYSVGARRPSKAGSEAEGPSESQDPHTRQDGTNDEKTAHRRHIARSFFERAVDVHSHDPSVILRYVAFLERYDWGDDFPGNELQRKLASLHVRAACTPSSTARMCLDAAQRLVGVKRLRDADHMYRKAQSKISLEPDEELSTIFTREFGMFLLRVRSRFSEAHELFNKVGEGCFDESDVLGFYAEALAARQQTLAEAGALANAEGAGNEGGKGKDKKGTKKKGAEAVDVQRPPDRILLSLLRARARFLRDVVGDAQRAADEGFVPLLEAAPTSLADRLDVARIRVEIGDADAALSELIAAAETCGFRDTSLLDSDDKFADLDRESKLFGKLVALMSGEDADSKKKKKKGKKGK